jgi:hypothetical protein
MELAEFMALEPCVECSSVFACDQTRASFTDTADKVVRWLKRRESRREQYTEMHFEMRAFADWFLFEVQQHEAKMCLSAVPISGAANTASDVADEVYNAIIAMELSQSQNLRTPLQAVAENVESNKPGLELKDNSAGHSAEQERKENRSLHVYPQTCSPYNKRDKAQLCVITLA